MRQQTYSANVKSVLPVLCSAIRVSPPSEEVHGGKRVGIDEVEYVYKQVCAPSASSYSPVDSHYALCVVYYAATAINPELLTDIARLYPILPSSDRLRRSRLSCFPILLPTRIIVALTTALWAKEEMAHGSLDRTERARSSILGIRGRHGSLGT